MSKKKTKLIISGILIFIFALNNTIVIVRSNEFSFDIDEFKEIVLASPNDSWAKPAQNRKNTICNKLTALQELILEGIFEEAYDKLLFDIKPKLTGLKTDENEEPWATGYYTQPWVIDEYYTEAFRIECNLILSEINPQSVYDDDKTPPIIVITHLGGSSIDDPGDWDVYVEDSESGLDEVIIEINGYLEIHEMNLEGEIFRDYNSLPVHAIAGVNTIVVTATNNDKDFVGDQETISESEWITISNTPTGTGVEVSDEETGVDITFNEVTEVGVTYVESSGVGPSVPSDFVAASDYYDITTDATFTGTITIAIPYDEIQIYINEQFLRLLHWDAIEMVWNDITIDVDFINKVVYGEVIDLSKFLIAEIILEDDEIIIIRDNFGVPHVFANTKEGLGFGVGYAMAQDRLWQMDVLRREANGSLAEFGFQSIEQDYYTRCLGYSRQEMRNMFDNWIPLNPNIRIKEMMLAFVDGVNRYIQEAEEAYAGGDPSLIPVEYLPEVVNVLPIAPWTIEDSIAILIRNSWRFGRSGGNELNQIQYIADLQKEHGDELGWKMFDDLFPEFDPGAPVTIPSEGSLYSTSLDSNDASVLLSEIPILVQSTAVEDSDYDLNYPPQFGGNAWMVNEQKSTSGNALQLGGPMVGNSIPSLFAEVGMHGAGINAVGMMLTSIPFILMGVSQHGAWTVTPGYSDLVDTYIEVLNPANDRQYYYNDGWVDLEHRIEKIYGYKKSIYVEMDVWRTTHGPIKKWDYPNHLCFTQKFPFFKNELAAIEGWMLLQDSKDVWDVEEACQNIDININVHWADRNGDIGYWHTGKFPIKPTYGLNGRIIQDRFPLWGTGKEEWIGLTGIEEMPKCINPPQGYLINWNNKPKADWSYTEVDWGEVSSITWIEQQIMSLEKVNFSGMRQINRNTGYNHINGMYFLDFLISAAKTDPSISSEVITALETWDYQYNDFIEPKWPSWEATYDNPGLTIFEAWFEEFNKEVFDDDLPTSVPANPSTLLHVLDGPDSKLPLNFDYLNGEERDIVIVRALKTVLTDLTAKYQTSEVSKWLIPVRIRFFSSLGALPSPVIHAMSRGSFNHIAEMKKTSLPYVVNILPPGQGGFMNYLFEFPHAYDQYPLYDSWEYKPVLFKYQKIIEVAESEKLLYYNII